MEGTLLEVDDVSKLFGATEALSRITFSATPSVVGLVGVNGAGKTTLLRAISGGIKPDRGTIGLRTAGSQPERGPALLRKHVALMPQAISPPRGMTLTDFMTYLAWLRAVPRRVRSSRIDSVLESVGLASMRSRRMTELSGGMLRRAAFAQALIGEPEVLLLDEPTTGVDPEQRLVMRELIAAHTDKRFTIVSSHVMEDIEAVASRVLMLDGGSLIFDGSLDALRATGEAMVGERSSLNPLEAAFMHLRAGTGAR